MSALPGTPLALLRDQMVRSQWAFLRAIECLEERQAGELLAAFTPGDTSAGNGPVRPLKRWPAIPSKNYNVYLQNAAQIRMRRILDYVQPGDRVLDVGTGYGYLAGVLLRDSSLSYYCGVDLMDHLTEATREMAAVNGLVGGAFHVETLDLFRLTPEFMAVHRPDLILVLEVIEHLRNPEEALRTVASAAPEEAAILLSVPMAGRLESCAGHVSFFHAEELRHLCHRVGLTVQYVESIHNAWVFVLASRCAEVLPRLTTLCTAEEKGTSASDVSRSASMEIAFPEPVSRYKSRWQYRLRRMSVSRDRAGLRCEIVGGPDSSGGQYGGVKFAARAPQALRLDLTLLYPDNIEAVYVEGYGDSNQRCIGWMWLPDVQKRLPHDRMTCCLLPGEPTQHFVPRAEMNMEAVKEIHLFLRVSPGSEAGFILHKAEIAPAPDAVD